MSHMVEYSKLYGGAPAVLDGDIVVNDWSWNVWQGYLLHPFMFCFIILDNPCLSHDHDHVHLITSHVHLMEVERNEERWSWLLDWIIWKLFLSLSFPSLLQHTIWVDLYWSKTKVMLHILHERRKFLKFWIWGPLFNSIVWQPAHFYFLDFVILIVLSTPGVVHMRKTLDKKIGRKNLMNKKNNKKNSIPNLHVWRK